MTLSVAITAPTAQPLRGGGSLLEKLRSATAEQHRQLEETVEITRRVSDRESYRQLLEKFYGFYAPIERQLVGTAAAKYEVMRGRFNKSRWLAQDLAQLGVSDVAQLPQLCALPPVDTPARVLGTMYVLEGSTLGGRHITALLNAGRAADLPKRFFSSYGSEVGSMWRSFCAALDELTDPADHGTAAENACATFESMRVWLREQS